MWDLGWKIKGQTCPLELIYSHCLIRFNISNENYVFGFNSIKNINFSKKSYLNALGSKFDFDVKYVKVNLRIIIWTNFVGPTSLVLDTKFQVYGPSGSREIGFWSVFTI